MPRRPAAWLAAVLAAVAAGALAACSGDGWEENCSTTAEGVIECAPGDRPAAPDVEGELLDGGRYDLVHDRGQIVVINFWGSWCAPCRAEIDDLEEVYQATKGQRVTFLGINIRDDRDKARAFHANRVSYPSLFDPAGRMALEFEVPPNAIPSTIILDRAGQIAVVLRRATRADELRPLVERVAAESSPDHG